MLLTRAPLSLRSVRLACVRHAASVRSEPGSNSQVRTDPFAPPRRGNSQGPLERGRSNDHPFRRTEIRRKAKTEPCLSRRSNGGSIDETTQNSKITLETTCVNGMGCTNDPITSNGETDYLAAKACCFANPIPSETEWLPSQRRRLRIPSHDTVFTFQRSKARQTISRFGADAPAAG